MPRGKSRTPPDRKGPDVTTQAGHIEIDWPRSLGFFGGVGGAAALGLIPLPIALFVAGVPFLKLMNRPNASRPQTFFGHLVDGAAKPVGGDSEGTVRWAPTPKRGGSGLRPRIGARSRSRAGSGARRRRP